MEETQTKTSSSTANVEKVGEWADRRIKVIEVALRTGNFSAARAHLRQLEQRGLAFDDSTPDVVDRETFVAAVFEQRIANALEKANIVRFRDLLVWRRDDLPEMVPNLGPKSLQTILDVCQEYFGNKTGRKAKP